MSMWLLRNNCKFQLTPDWRLIGKLDYSVSNSSLGQFYAGGYTEGVIGYGYRPVRNDRLNVLAKYTYFYNVPTPDQLGLLNTAAEFLQKSHIASVDATYDLTANWSIGSKYAYRLGEESLDRVAQDFFSNPAQLAVLRLDWRFFKQWESMAEVRTLDLPDLNQSRRGGTGGDLSSSRQGREGRRRLQFHRFLRRLNRPEVQPQRRILQYHRDQVKLRLVSKTFPRGILKFS